MKWTTHFYTKSPFSTALSFVCKWSATASGQPLHYEGIVPARRDDSLVMPNNRLPAAPSAFIATGTLIITQKRLTAEQRQFIFAHLQQGLSGAAIARLLGRDPSVINREIKQHGHRGQYCGVKAHARAGRRPQAANRNKIADNPALLSAMLDML